MKTIQEIEPVLDEGPPQGELVQAELVQAAIPGNKNLSVLDQFRVIFAKPAKYVINCTNMTDETWTALYPPVAPECKQLPGSGLPDWTHSWNYCLNCHTLLRDCLNNPYGFNGTIGRARMEAALQNRIIRSQLVQSTQIVTEVVNELTGEVTKVVTTEILKGRAKHGTFKQVVPADLQKDIRDKYLAGSTLNELSQELLIASKPIRDFLAEEGILRKRGELVASKTESNVTEQANVTEEENVASKPRGQRGKKRTTLFVTEELVIKVAKMLTDGIGGGLVQIAKTENVNSNELSVALKATGVVITRGLKKGSKVATTNSSEQVKAGNYGVGRGRVRSTNLLTPELVTKISKMLADGKGGGMVNIAKTFNVSPSELSLALKESGVVLRKGYKKGLKKETDQRLLNLVNKY